MKSAHLQHAFFGFDAHRSGAVRRANASNPFCAAENASGDWGRNRAQIRQRDFRNQNRGEAGEIPVVGCTSHRATTTALVAVVSAAPSALYVARSGALDPSPHLPTRAPQQHRDAPLAILPILSSQDLFLRNFTKSSCLLYVLGDMLVTSDAWRK
jgi:hypothetical protein